jgi:hypothetical protein
MFRTMQMQSAIQLPGYIYIASYVLLSLLGSNKKRRVKLLRLSSLEFPYYCNNLIGSSENLTCYISNIIQNNNKQQDMTVR